jgi:hypothetical protein
LVLDAEPLVRLGDQFGGADALVSDAEWSSAVGSTQDEQS